jgi:hypothetical protein
MNTQKTGALFLTVLLLAGPGGAFAQTRPLEMKWSELSPLIGGHRVAVLLNDGISVKGEVVAVREDTILLDVSVPVKGYQKGSGSIPRNSIALVDLERSRGAWGRTMGTVIGVLGGMTLGGYVLAKENGPSAGAALATFLGIAAGGSLAGYYAGRAIDKRVTQIKIVP